MKLFAKSSSAKVVALLPSDFVGRLFQTGAVRARVQCHEGEVRRARAERDVTDFFGLGLVERAGARARVPEFLFWCLFLALSRWRRWILRVPRGAVEPTPHLHAIAAPRH